MADAYFVPVFGRYYHIWYNTKQCGVFSDLGNGVVIKATGLVLLSAIAAPPTPTSLSSSSTPVDHQW
jgi:hypothetical protein